MKTEAFVLKNFGEATKAFELSEIELKAVGADEVLIKTEGFGLNYADVMARQGLYGETPELPCVVGYEVVGEVIEVGDKVDASKIGKRVVAFTRFGGYAKHVVVPATSIIEVDTEDLSELTALVTQGATAYYMAQYHTHLHVGQTALVHAASGGVGQLLIQLLKSKGVKVIAKVGSTSKVETAKALGADFVINYKEEDYVERVKAYTGENGLDMSFNAVAGSTYKADLKLLNPGGKLFLFGGAELSQYKGPFGKIKFILKMGLMPPIGFMMMSKSIIGVNMLKIGDHNPMVLAQCLREVYDLYKKGELKIANSTTVNSNELALAHHALESGESKGKIAVKW